LTVLSGGGFKRPLADPDNGIADKPESWVSSPAHYILMHEPPARLYGCMHGPEWYQWHYARGVSDIHDPKRAPAEFFSALLFVDGHTAVLNFTKSLAADPYYPYEPTRDWIWYEPATEARPER
jgi:hypothetical protein